MKQPVMPSNYFHYWGKAQAREGDAEPYHLLPYHCLDVAAVGVAYLRSSPALLRLLSNALGGVSNEALCTWLGFCLALHDLGKFSEAFQSQRADLFVILRSRAPDAGRPYTIRHDSLGWHLWTEVLKEKATKQNWFGDETEDALYGIDWWLRASTGHHGQPPKHGGGSYWKHHFLPEEDVLAVDGFISELFVLFPREILVAFIDAQDAVEFEDHCKTLSWWVAGLAVLADWLGSNTDFFPYRSGQIALSEYWDIARVQAEKALNATDVLPARCLPAEFSDLFPFIDIPSPLQEWAAMVPIPEEPQIHLLEDVTGAGKTEAAVALAHRIMASGCADGFFIGLPTMATANAMYGRIAGVYQRQFADHASLVLAHGQRNLVEAFAASILPSGLAEDDPHQKDDTATVRCNAWLADHNKRALLAPAGVGTVDQVLLAVLYSKHQSLRLLGLFRKVLVIDEVHACDPYMLRVLETVLEFHAQVGGSAILLSATLSRSMKQSLLNAFARGAGAGRAPGMRSMDFPLVTSWYPSAPAVIEQDIETRPDVCRELSVRYVSEEAEVAGAIRAALADGKCVCWMRNTVADALAAHALFNDELPPERLILFHARFTLRDRLNTEQRILGFFGKSSTPTDRAGRLVIATQVAEQSLDADWDYVVSDLAPIDRLIQRAGRLQRHPRSPDGRRLTDPSARDQRGQPCLWVLGPVWSEEPAANWFKQAFPKAAGVYGNHGELWLTAQALQQGRIVMPADARSLIEGVFGDAPDLPKGLEGNVNLAEGQAFADTSIAQQNTIKLTDGYERGGVDWWSEAKTPSRLGEASMTVLLGRWEGDRLRPWVEHPDPRHAWAYSSLRVAERLIAARAPETDITRESQVLALLETLPGKGKWSVLLVLNGDECAGTGRALSAPRREEPPRLLEWCYDVRNGLVQAESELAMQEDCE